MSATSFAIAATALAVLMISPPNSAHAQPNAAPGTVLQSITPEKDRVPMVDVTVLKLKEIGVDIKQLLKACDTARAGAIAATKQGGKPDYDGFINAISPTIDRMKTRSELFTSGKEGFEITNELRVAIQPSLEAWMDGVNDVIDQMSELGKSAKEPTASNMLLADSVSRIKETIYRIDAARRRVLKAVRHTSQSY
jgi:hypothetical protein